MENLLEIKTAIQIGRPIFEVFDAIVEPGKMSGYFIQEGSARLEKGKTVEWKFPEFDVRFHVRVGDVIPDSYISFFWDSGNGTTRVEFDLRDGKEASTVVTVTEGKMEYSEAAIKWLKGNTEGWANFLACLKAYLEFGINLRSGAFDYPKE